MVDLSSPSSLPGLSAVRRMDRVWLTILAILAALALIDFASLPEVVAFALRALANTLIFIAFAVFAVGYLKASGAESLVAKAFTGSTTRMIVLAALAGGLSPFCSCEVIPFIAAMLALGVPLAAVMAFWLSSPLMDPPMFIYTAGELGLAFAIAKTLAAIGIGLVGGLGVRALSGTGYFNDPLKEYKTGGCGCSARKAFSGAPVWKFWTEGERLTVFRKTVSENALFLLKWLSLAYLIEALMVRYIPAETVASVLGGDGLQPILLGALVGGPAYLNGYAAVPLMSGLLDQGMSDGAAMAFVLAGGVSSIPAALAVWALVKPRVFAAYLGFAMVGAVSAGVIWNAVV